MLPRATWNAVAGHNWPAGRYLPTPGLEGLDSSLAQSAGELWHLAKMSKYTFRGISVFTKNLVFEP